MEIPQAEVRAMDEHTANADRDGDEDVSVEDVDVAGDSAEIDV